MRQTVKRGNHCDLCIVGTPWLSLSLLAVMLSGPPDTLSSVNGVDLVVGNTQKHDLVRMVLSLAGDYIESQPIGREGWSWPGAFGRTRSMVKIQEGCNQVCAYCIVPKVRGRERSIPVDFLLSQVQNRVVEGFKEVVLTGTQLGSYGYIRVQQML